VATHVKALGAIFLALGTAGVLAGILSSVAFGLLAGIAGVASDEALGSTILGLTGLALTILLLLVSAPAIVCGWGLLKFRSWARILAIVLAAISLVAFPYGTLFGIYALWVLLTKETEVVFVGPA
jgi:hypothetical protein